MAQNRACSNCRHGDWEEDGTECKRCIGYSRWEKNLKPRAVFMGHRKEYIKNASRKT